MKTTIVGIALLASLLSMGLAPSASPVPHACALLTKNVATRLLGPSAALTDRPPSDPPLSGCRFQNSTTTWIDVVTGPWSAMKQDVAGQKAIGGLGDEAYFAFVTTLYVRKGVRGIEISVSEPGNASGAAAEAAFARERARAKDVATALLPQL